MVPTEAELEAIAKRRVQARTGLVMNVVSYLVVNGGLFVVWLVTGRGYPWFVWPMVGWGIGLVLHAAALRFGPDSPTEKRAIEREMARLRAGLGSEPPPYRG
jgi:hypothetical protein